MERFTEHVLRTDASERLRLYKAALADYEKSGGYYYLSLGFCYYFWERFGLVIYTSMDEILPELYAERAIKQGLYCWPMNWEKVLHRRDALRSAITKMEERGIKCEQV